MYAQLVQYARDLRKLLDSQHEAEQQVVRVDVRRSGATRLIGESPLIREVIAACKRVAATPTPVLVLGETGTGKELVARLVHEYAHDDEAPFIAVNCAALPESLVESELFGHEKGAFTNATETHEGVFERAAGGTLLLDEVGELPLHIQAKLLRVLDNGEVCRVGGTKTIRFEARFIAATNRDLESEVAAKRFREDLFYRLNVFAITVPSLAARIEDVPLLAEYFLAEFTPQGSEPKRLCDEALQCLQNHTWPGNVRELRNVIERAVVLADDVIEVDHLAPHVLAARGTPSIADSQFAQHERLMVVKALEDNDWNKAAAARALGISWDNLRYRVKKYSIKRRRAS